MKHRSKRLAVEALSWLLLYAALACAPSSKTVALVSVGNTGCPAEDLAVFNYEPDFRRWRAACKDKLYVCSDIRGATECTLQDPATFDADLAARAKLLMTLPKARRDAFIEYNIVGLPWDDYSRLVQAVGKLSADQLDDIDDLDGLYTRASPELNAKVKGCVGKDGVIQFQSDGGRLLLRQHAICKAQILRDPSLQHLTARPGTYYLATDVFGFQPLPRPNVAAPQGQASDTKGATAEPLPADSTAQEAAPPETQSAAQAPVRAWLDEAAEDILACTGTERAPIYVSVDEQGNPTLSLRDEHAGSAAEACVRAAVDAQQFEPGPLEVLHLVKTKPAE